LNAFQSAISLFCREWSVITTVGKIFHPHGVEIDLPFWLFKRLKKLQLLERDGATGRRRIKAHISA
jgi:hypothetical protein